MVVECSNKNALFKDGNHIFLFYTIDEDMFIRLLNLNSELSDNEPDFWDFSIEDT